MAAVVSTILLLPLSSSPNSGAAVTDTHISVRVTAVAPEHLRAAVSERGNGALPQHLRIAESGLVPRSETCRSAVRGLKFYVRRANDWRHKMGQDAVEPIGPANGRACPYTLWRAQLWRSRSFAARRATERWQERHTLRDFPVTSGSNAWLRAVREAQRAFPNTSWWLLSCSASEGGWGRWVPNSDGAPPGGWMQMYESTFWRMWGTAWRDVTARGFRVPRSAHSWFSPLGQALASAWGLTHGRRGEWNSSGC